jgi:NAD(P)-dependent dehydrogenase (short-subunit alcohol dehydrogenase family)
MPENPFDLTGQVALISGGAGGLGQAMAEALIDAGAAVALGGRNQDSLERAAHQLRRSGGSVSTHVVDLSDADAPAEIVDAVVADHGKLDVLVHAAGGQVRKPALAVTIEEWHEIHNVHLRAAFFLAQRAGQHLIDREATGSIIFIGSLTSYAAVPNVSVYSGAKSGLLGIARSLAREWGPKGVRVNTLVPGMFHTDLTDMLFQDPKGRDWVLSKIPMARAGVPEDLAGAVVFLASDAAGYVTGTSLVVDGGWLAG